MVHRYQINDCKIVLDVNSGAVHVVDEIVYEILGLYEDNDLDNIVQILKNKYLEQQIKSGYEEIKELIKQNLLYTEDHYRDSIHLQKDRGNIVKALCLHIAHDCNLKCQYCFAEEGEYHGKRELMSFEVGKAAIDFIIKNSGSRRNLEIDFFGGEPLMNFNVVKAIVEYARGMEKQYNKNFRFTITTNGVLLNEEIKNYINENMQNVVLSIDGRKSINDHMRKTVGGKGTYDKIVPVFQDIAESRNQDNYYVRGTFTHNNLDFSKDVMHLADLGFKQISVEPVVADSHMNYSIKEEDLPQIYEEYERLANEMLERKKENKSFNFFHFMIDLSGGPCIAKRITGCGAGGEYLAVVPNGDLYPCHQFAGMQNFKMGTVFEGVTNQQKRKMFEEINVYTKNECKDCFAKFYCSGGCVANAYNQNGDLNKPYEISCKMQRKRVECAIYMLATEI